MGEGKSELEHSEQEDHEHRDDEGKLNEPLAALSKQSSPRRRPTSMVRSGRCPTSHRTGSMRMALDCTSVVPFPLSDTRFARGVTQVCRYVTFTPIVSTVG